MRLRFLLSVFPALIYMCFYVNGYFGDRLVNWWLLKDIVDSIFHPINILGWVVVVFVLLRLLGKKFFYIVQHSGDSENPSGVFRIVYSYYGGSLSVQQSPFGLCWYLLLFPCELSCYILFCLLDCDFSLNR